MAETARPEGWFARPIGPSPAADEATRVAGRLAAPSEGATPAGLPTRTPKAHLVPGAFTGGAAEEPPHRSADEVRDRLSGFQRGTRKGRAES